MPYPPSYWPQFRYWQFANWHNPYLATQYTGEDETARLERAALDTVFIGLGETLSQEPMQMYLDTNSQEMIVWPIYAFQSSFNLTGDYDLYTYPGDEWRYYLVSGMSSNMTNDASFEDAGPFMVSGGFTGFSIAPAQHAKNGANQVCGYILAQGVVQYPNLNTNAETFSDLAVYKAMSLLDTFPIGDQSTLMAFLDAEFPNAPFVANEEINAVFASNISSYINTLQEALIPQ